jgi:hypothetical protein
MILGVRMATDMAALADLASTTALPRATFFMASAAPGKTLDVIGRIRIVELEIARGE